MKQTVIGFGALVAIAACSPVKVGGDAGDIDAASGDGGAGVADAAVGTATVVVYDWLDNSPRVGASVVFSNPDGSQRSIGTTDDDGAVASEVVAGGSVTAGYSRPGDQGGAIHFVQTVFGVLPGDLIELGPLSVDPTYEPVGEILVAVPGDVDGAGSYQVGNRCNQTFPDATAPATYYHQDERCTHGQVPIDLLGIAWDEAGGDIPLAYSFYFGLEPSETIYVGTDWASEFEQLYVAAGNAPFPGVVDARLRLLHSGIDYDFSRGSSTRPITTGAAVDLIFPHPPDFIETLQLQLQVRNEAADDMRMYLRNFDPSTQEFDLDLTADLLPGVADVTLDDSDRARPELGWTYRDRFASTSGGLGYVVWFDSPNTWTWQFLVPPDAAPPFRMPELPADFVEVWPIGVDANPVTHLGGYVEGGRFPGWSEMRQQRGLGIVGEDGVLLPVDAPPGAEVRVSAGGLFFD